MDLIREAEQAGDDLCLHTLFRRQALATPASEAIYSTEVSLSYSKLNAITDVIARHLHSAGVGADCYVPLCFDKSPWAIVAMLAILKAEAAFVPLNPKHPKSRLDSILGQIQAQFLLCGPETRSRFADSNLTVFELSAQSVSSLTETDKPTILPIPNPRDAAYAIFTSGSTGTPKGVITEHRAICTALLSRAAAQQRSSATRVVQFSSYTFDMSIEDIFSTLMLGGTVCSPTEHQRMNSLAAFMEEARVNTGHFTPSTVAAITPEEVPSMTKLLLMGEAITTENLQIWAPQVTVLNNYGPTEASAVSIVSRPLRVNDNPSDLGVSYGCLSWLVNPHNHHCLAAAGAVAELLLEGPTLGREYLGQPERTAEAYIINPTWADGSHGQDRRFYKTGDLVRYNADGTIRYLGRKDMQIKIRGQCIELGEIESCLQNLAPSSKFVVEIVPNLGGSKEELVAFVVMSENGETSDLDPPSADMMRRVKDLKPAFEKDLFNRLPAVMVPRFWIPIHSLPLSASGKRDRGALQSYARRVVPAQATKVPSIERSGNTNNEKLILRNLWAAILKQPVNSISDDDDFIRKGGDSISAMRLAALSRNEGLQLTVADIMRCPNFRDMAAKCSESPNGEAAANEQISWRSELWDDADFMKRLSLHSNIRKNEIQDILPLTDFQKWSVMTDKMKSRGWSNYLIITLSQPVVKDRLVKAVHKVAQHHPILRTAFVAGRPDLSQVVLSSSRITATHEICDKTAMEEKCAAWVDKITRAESLLGYGTLRLLSKGSSEDSVQKIALTLSHAQFDGTSLSWLCDDLAIAYQGTSLQARAPFANFLTQAALGNQDASISFWRSLLFRSPMSQVIARPPSQLFQHPVAETHERLIDAPTGQTFTFATILKAAWALVLSQHLHERDLVFGHLVSGRAALSPEVASVMGPRINILPVRVRLDEQQTGSQLLSAVQQQHVDAMPHESLGFSRIIDECTEWPRGTRFSSIVQHQNMDDVSSLKLGDIAADVTLSCPDHDSTDVWVISIPEGNKIRVTLSCNATLVPDKQATMLLDELVANIHSLVSPASRGASPAYNGTLHLNGITNGVGASNHVRETVDNVWSEVVGVASDTVPFYNVRGDYAAAFLLMTRYRELAAVTMEEIYDHPTKLAQFQLLTAKASL